jgi:hypothetical protein
MRSHRHQRLGRVGLAVLATAATFAIGAGTAGAVPPDTTGGAACYDAMVELPAPAVVSKVLFKDRRITKKAGMAACVDQNYVTKRIGIRMIGRLPTGQSGCELKVRWTAPVPNFGAVPCSDPGSVFAFNMSGYRANQRIPILAIVYANGKPVLRWAFEVVAR